MVGLIRFKLLPKPRMILLVLSRYIPRPMLILAKRIAPLRLGGYALILKVSENFCLTRIQLFLIAFLGLRFTTLKRLLPFMVFLTLISYGCMIIFRVLKLVMFMVALLIPFNLSVFSYRRFHVLIRQFLLTCSGCLQIVLRLKSQILLLQ